MALRFLTAGESHGPVLIAILDGVPAGIAITPEMINLELARRQYGYGAGPRMKIEKDAAIILGGVMEGITTGAPLALQIENSDHVRWRGKQVSPFTIPRPGHADLTGAIKYGYTDLRPALERASARETAARVAVGAVCKTMLSRFGIRVGGYVISIGEIRAEPIERPDDNTFRMAEANEVRCPDPAAAEKMIRRIRQVMEERNTLGGIIEIVVLGLPPGLGSYVQWDRRLESRLGAAILSVPAVKGVEFGPAFDNARLPGTEVHDPIRVEDDRLIRLSNRAGGLEGGITNGEPLMIRAAMKPIATTLKAQQTVNLATGEEADTQYERSDFCPVPRAVPILEAMTAFTLAEVLIEKLGGDSLNEMLPRYEQLRGLRLSDLQMDNKSHLFWPDLDEGKSE